MAGILDVASLGSRVAVGDLLDGKYRIARPIGRGGWSIVFEGENIRTLKRVAIKMLRTRAGVTPDILARFEREAQAAGRIGSEHIVEVYDLGTLPDGTRYMVMELLTGEELSSRLRFGGPIDPVQASLLMVQLLEGLDAAHAAGILHRDLKPANLFLVPARGGGEFVKILDFGISKFNHEPEGSATMTGAVLGSPSYMAPEQARGLKQIDARTDLYAVGTLFFECLTGRVPFAGDNFNDLMFRIVLAPRPDPRDLRPEIDAGLAAVVTRAMAADPVERFQSAAAMRGALVEWLASKGVACAAPELKRAAPPPPSDPRESGARESGASFVRPPGELPERITARLSPDAPLQAPSEPPPMGESVHFSDSDIRTLGGASSGSGAVVVAKSWRARARVRAPFIALGVVALGALAVAGIALHRGRPAADGGASAPPAGVIAGGGGAQRAPVAPPAAMGEPPSVDTTAAPGSDPAPGEPAAAPATALEEEPRAMGVRGGARPIAPGVPWSPAFARPSSARPSPVASSAAALPSGASAAASPGGSSAPPVAGGPSAPSGVAASPASPASPGAAAVPLAGSPASSVGTVEGREIRTGI